MSSRSSKTKTRRDFLITSGRAVAGLVAAASWPMSASAHRRILGANDRVRLAVIGVRSRGMDHLKGFAALPNVHVKTIVDVDENLFANAIKGLEGIQKEAPATEPDLRRMLDDKEIDAVTIATPDHWHALAAIWACQAGKHVYVEKPCSHNIWEGRRIVESARKHNRVVEVGFQNRSIKNVRRAMQFLHDGGIGDVFLARGLCFKPRDSIGHKADEPVPAGVHYDTWLGPAPARPFNRNRFHYEWHWHWDYGCGDIGNQGPHQFDIARWGLNEAAHPVKVSSMGGYFAWDSDQQTPNTQSALFEYASGKILQFEVRGLYTSAEDGIQIGNLFYGTKGWMHLDGSTWKTYFGRNNEPGPGSETVEAAADPMNLAGAGGGNHYENFINAVRSGEMKDLTCDIEEGHRSTVLPHLANISYRLGRTLTFDGAHERFVNDAEADRMLTREYRAPYVVPAST